MKQNKACPDWIETLSAEVDGELGLSECQRVAEHLAQCEGCRVLREAFLLDRDRFIAEFDAVTAEVSLAAPVLEQLPRRKPWLNPWIRWKEWFTAQPRWSWAGAGITVVLLALCGSWIMRGTLFSQEGLGEAAAQKAPDAAAFRTRVAAAPQTMMKMRCLF